MKRALLFFLISFCLIFPKKQAFCEDNSFPSWYEAIHNALKEQYNTSVPFSKIETLLALFYAKRGFHPAWITPQGWAPCGKKIFETLLKADQEGLDREDYRIPAEKIRQTPFDPQNLQELFQTEIALTSVVLTYIQDLKSGRLNPRTISKLLYLNPDPVDAPTLLHQGLIKDPTGTWFADLTVNHPQYQALKKILSFYRSLETREIPLPVTALKGLKKGEKSEQIPLLRRYLFLTKDLATPSTSILFDEELGKAICHFQKHHGLEEDGVIGNQTLKALNTPLQERLKQILVSMEQWRWAPQNLGERFLLVNIAGFSLEGFEKNQKVLQLPVIIGQRYRKTPVFYSIVDAVRFNPSWNVPKSIAVKDKLPKIKQDPSYLSRKNFILYDLHGQVLDPQNVPWSHISARNFSFRLRQTPGRHNALGKIGFNVQSPFDIYLHDTPDKHLFKKPRRAFSSGCIRVSSPVELAFFVFNNSQEWSREKIERMMVGAATRTVFLKNPVPIFITYLTVWEDEEGLPYFVEDLYGQDKVIWEALQRRRGL